MPHQLEYKVGNLRVSPINCKYKIHEFAYAFPQNFKEE